VLDSVSSPALAASEAPSRSSVRTPGRNLLACGPQFPLEIGTICSISSANLVELCRCRGTKNRSPNRVLAAAVLQCRGQRSRVPYGLWDFDTPSFGGISPQLLATSRTEVPASNSATPYSDVRTARRGLSHHVPVSGPVHLWELMNPISRSRSWCSRLSALRSQFSSFGVKRRSPICTL
jgi:hypothetical protein